MYRHFDILSVILLVAGILPAAAVAADAPSDSLQGWNLSFTFENDIMWVDDSDRHYTAGFQLTLHNRPGRVWGWLESVSGALMPGGPETRFMRFGFGQNLYTPENLVAEELVENDRPYAGWLHGDLGVTGLHDRSLSVLELSLGMVGPSAGGQKVQDWFHEIVGSVTPLGWEHQINDEFAFLAVYERTWGNAVPPGSAGLWGLEWDLVPTADVNLGNVFTHLQTGATLRLGSHLAQDLGPVLILPSPPRATLPSLDRQFQWYVYGGVAGRLVLWNIFLDGNTSGDSHSVPKNALVGDANMGISMAYRGFRASYTFTVRSPEFEEQRRPDHFGSVTLSYSP